MAAKEQTNEQTTIRVELEGRYAGWWADCDDDPDWAFLGDLSGFLTTGQFGPTGEALLRVIVRWNFTDKQGREAPVSAEGLRQVSARAVLDLANAYLRRWSQLPNPSAAA